MKDARRTLEGIIEKNFEIGRSVEKVQRYMGKYILSFIGEIMKACVLYSGGKDSNLALYKASKRFEVICLVNMVPESSESMLFHFPNSELTKLQSKALGIPLLQEYCKNDEKSQIVALRDVLARAKKEFNIDTVVTGAVKSRYQFLKFGKVFRELGLNGFHPLWMREEKRIIEEIIRLRFDVIITRIAGYPFKEEFLGKRIDENFLKYLENARMSVVGEGGEYETFVRWMPLFKKRIRIIESKKILGEYEGEYVILKAELV